MYSTAAPSIDPSVGHPRLPEGWMPEEIRENPRREHVNLVFVRQSGVGAREDLNSMLERTLMQCAGVPGWDTIRRAELGPLLTPERYPDALTWTLPDGGSASLWWVESTFVLYVLGSAAKSNLTLTPGEDPEANAASALLSSVIEELKPHLVFAGRFDRAVRAMDHSISVFNALRRAGTLFFHFDGKSINLQAPKAKLEWEAETVQASVSHYSTVNGMMGGRVSKIRLGRWALSAPIAPLGFSVDDDQRLVIDPAEQEVVLQAIRALAQPDADLGTLARLLGDSRSIPRRRTGLMRHGIDWESNDPLATYSRARSWLRRLLHDLPDLAMGKHVVAWKEPSTISAIYPGARKVLHAGGKAEYRLVFDLPDLFADLDEDTLRPVLINAIERRLQKGRRATSWLEESEARELVRLHSPQGVVEEGWAGRNGELVDLMAGAPALRPWIMQLAHQLEIATPPALPEPHRHKRVFLLCGYPVWRDEQGREVRLVSDGHSYEVRRRPTDGSMPPYASSRRAWDRRRGPNSELIAKCSPDKLHEAVALAAVTAVEMGVPLISKSAVLLRELDVRQGGMPLSRAQRISELEAALMQAEQDAIGASRRAERVGAGGPAPQRAVEHADQRALDAWMRHAELEERLHVLRSEAFDEPVETPNVFTSDLEVVADALARISVTRRAPRHVSEAIRRVIPSLRLVHADELSATFEFTLALLDADRDRIVVGPIKTTVPLNWRQNADGESRARVKARALCTAPDVDRAALEAFTFAADDRRRDEAPENEARTYLVSSGMRTAAATNVLSCPLPLVKRLVWAIHEGDSLHAFEHLDPGYIAIVRAAYFGDLVPQAGPYSSISDLRQQALDRVIAHGGERRFVSLGDDLFGDPVPNQRAILRRATIEGNATGLAPLVSKGPEGRDGRSGRPGLVVGARPCPHCSPESGSFLDQVLVVPEIPSGLFCSTCRRSADPSSPLYPEEYVGLRELVYRDRRYEYRSFAAAKKQ